MSAALYVGRVGALAVALGIGVAIAGAPGLAWAGPEPGSDPADSPGTSQGPSTDPGDSPGDTGDTDDKDLEGGGDSGDAGDPGKVDDSDGSAGGMKVDSSGGALTSTHGKAGAKSNKDRVADQPKRRSMVKPRNLSVAASAPKTAAQSVDQAGHKAQVRLAPSGVAPSKAPAAPQLKQASTPVVDATPLTRNAVLWSPATATMTAVPKSAAAKGVSRLLSLVTLSAPTAGDTTPVSTDSPLFAAFFAAGRQVSQNASVDDESAARTVGAEQNSLMMAAVTSSPPGAGTLDQTTGTVTGSLNGWTITSQPTSGTVTANGDTYTYTPTAVARLRAATTTQPDYDSFGVAMSGQPASTVTVPIMPAVLSNQSAIPKAGQPVLNNPTGLAVNGTTAYVANQGTNTVSVINTATGAVVKTITVGSQPSAVVINPATGLAYVTNRASGTVSVINTASNTVVGSAIRVGTSPQDVAVNTTGTPIVVVANNGSSSLSIIEPSLNNKVTTVSLGLGNSAPTAVALSADGTRAYVTHRTISGGGAVSVIDTSTKKVIATVAVGSSPVDVGVAGTKVYVANSNSSSVSVINTATNNSVTTINVGSSPSSLAVSPDGSMVVVARNNDNIAVIDTKTNTVVGAQLLLDTTTPDGGHVVAFGSDGRIFITDAADRTVRVVGFARGNTAPITTAGPTVDNQDTATGVVSGALNIKDPDQDPLKYTVSGVPAATGSVTVDSTGTYTFTPSQAARDQAAKPGGPNTITFTVHATDPSQAYKDVTVTVPVLPTPASTPGGVSATTTQIPLGAWPDFLVSRGSRLYVLNAGESTVSVVDTNTNTLIQKSEPLLAGGAMTLSPDGKSLYVAEYMGNHIYVLDPQTLQQVGAPINVVTTYGGTLAVSPDSTRLYVGSTDVPVYYDEYGDPVYGDSSAYVSVVDTANRTVVAQIPVGTSVGNVELSPDGKLLYANAPDRVYVIDTATNTQVASFTVGGQPADVTFSPDSTRAYITNLSSGELYVVDTATNAVIATPIIDTEEYRYFPEWDYEHEAGFPTDLAMSGDGSRVYIGRGDDIVVLDAATDSVIGTIRVATDIPNEGAQSLTVGEDGTVFVTLEDTVVAVDVAPSAAQSNLALAKGSTAGLMAMAAVANSAPTASPTMGAPDGNTGVIVGKMNASDAEQNPMTYTVSGQPTRGTVTVDAAGAFKYTPTQAERLLAGQTTGVDPDSFTITVADGQGGTTPVTVQVAVLPALTAVKADMALGSGANPSAVAVKGNLAYVADATAKTVKVVNTDTNLVVATIPVQTSPSAIALSPDGNSVWVANSGSKTVQRIDTRSNTVTATVTVGTTPTALAVTDDSVWVANAGSNNVSRINTSTVAVRNITVGQAPSAVAVSGDRVYVANKNGNSISVISTSSNTVVSTKSSVSSPSALAVTGGKVYVTQQSLNRVLVLNSSTMAQITTISVQSAPTSIAIANDGSLAYVVNSNDRLSVIDTKTNVVISTLTVGTPGSAGSHTVAVDRTGASTGVYVTDTVEKSVRGWSLPRGNTAPVSTANPTVDANLTTGVVSGLVNVKDTDGDSLTYSAAAPPGNGAVTFDAAAGTYTYTPTQPARDAAALTPGDDFDTFTIRVTDSYNAIKDVSVTVPVAPTPVANRAPQAGTPSIDNQNSATGAVSGLLNFTDPDGNPMTYSVPTQPSSGTVTFVGSRYTFTPYQAARDAAAVSEGPDAVNITVVASDGELSTPVTFSVPILPPNPPNHAPAHGAPSVDTTVNSSGAVSGSLNFTDPEGDPMTYSVPVQPSSGTVTFSGSRYSYTPTAAARAAAAATQGADLATITVVASDGLASDSVTFTVPIMQSVKATNRAPWVPGSTIPRTFDPVGGTVTGYVNVEDPDGDTLIYTLASAPTKGGTVTFDQRSGYFTYTPSQAARAQAAQTPGLDYDTFSVNITDGTATVNTTVQVQVAAALPPTTPTTNSTVNAGTGPSGVVVLKNGNAYVVYYDSNTVTVINTATNQAVKTIEVGAGPLSVAAVDTPGRQRVYVSNSLSNTVSVIDPNTNTVIDTITVSIPPGVYENPEWGTFEYQDRIDEVVASGNRLYVHATDGTLRVYDTTNDGKTLIRTDAPGVFSDLELSADGTRLYGTSAGRLLVYDTATMTPVNVVVGPGAGEESDFGRRLEYTNGVGNVAMSSDGKRAYITYSVTILQSGVGGQPYGSFVTDASGKTWMVTGGYNAVSVIDTDHASANYNKEIARILVPQGAQDLAVSGNRLYVMNPDNKTVTIIDTATNRLVGSFTTDQSTAGRDGIYIPIDGYPMFYVPSSSRYIAVGPTGTIYVTDYADGKLYAVTDGSLNV